MRHSRAYATLPTAAFVDYDDLYHTLLNKAGRAGQPESTITEAISALTPLLQRQMNAQVISCRAYADFATLSAPNETMSGLSAAGVQPVFVAGEVQRNAPEIELTMDVCALLASRADVRRVVVVTGSRLHLPLLRRIKEQGRAIVLVSVEPLLNRNALLLDDGDRVLSLMELVPDVLRSDAALTPPPPRDVEYHTIEDEGALRALEIIEEFFGQYNEVYLTPLLRKLSDEVDDDTIDPKTVISDLEEAGAVYLEKRRGYPHDYTVLIVDANHPDVDRVRQMFEDYDEDDEEGEDDEDLGPLRPIDLIDDLQDDEEIERAA